MGKMTNEIADQLRQAGFKNRADRDGGKLVAQVHELLWAEIDENGFVTLTRQSESLSRDQRLTLPRSIRTIPDVAALLHLLSVDTHSAYVGALTTPPQFYEQFKA